MDYFGVVGILEQIKNVSSFREQLSTFREQ